MTKRTSHKLLLVLTFIVLAASTIAWNVADRTPPPWDPADHINTAYDYYQALANADFRGFASDFFYAPHYYAPLAHLATAGVFLILGASRVSAILVNLISLAVLLASVDWMARRLYPFRSHNGDRILFPPGAQASRLPASQKTNTAGETPALPAEDRIHPAGLLAALLATCYHFSAWLLHDAFVDYPLIAIVALSMAMLIRAGDFSTRRYAIQLGVALGLGMLTKQTFPFFFALPVVYAALVVLRRGDRKAIVNLALAGLICAAIASVWYLPHLDDVRAIYNVNRQAAINENEALLFSFQSNVHYVFGLISPQMQLPFGLLFAGGLFYSLWRRRRESVMVHLWLVSGLLTFTLVANKDMRYTVPLLPAAAIISVCWLPDLAESIKPVRIAGLVATILIGAWAFAGFFNAQWPRDGQGCYIDTPRFRFMVFGRNYYGMDHAPRSEDWSVTDIVERIAERGSAGGEAKGTQPLLGVVVNLPFLNPSTVALHARLLATGRGAPPVIYVDWLIGEESLSRVGDCDYLLVRTGLNHADWVAPAERAVEKMISESPNRFTRVAGFPIPLKEAEAVVYEINKQR